MFSARIFCYSNLKNLTSTRQVLTVRLENEKLSNEVINNVKTYILFYLSEKK